jgi:putative transposase
VVGMIACSYYRTPSFCKKGNKPSKFTFHKDKGMVSQKIVIKSVKSILSHEFIDCGYRIMTTYLKRNSYTINHKKRYRIMKEEIFLKSENRINRSGAGRKFVKF